VPRHIGNTMLRVEQDAHAEERHVRVARNAADIFSGAPAPLPAKFTFAAMSRVRDQAGDAVRNSASRESPGEAGRLGLGPIQF